jgi:ubiquinone/menaquinone biosynthesis C-methylase UbiE
VRPTLRLSCILATLILAICAVPVARAQDDSTDVVRLVRVLEISAGQSVAEIGAGSGVLTLAMAREVGETGRVYSSELGEKRVHELQQAVEKTKLPQITVVTGDPVATSLAEACCDALFMRNVYHHFGDPQAMNASVFRSLKPGGRLAVIDFAPSSGKEAARPEDRDEDGTHGITADTLMTELKQAGFEVTSVEPTKDRWFMVVARRP